MPTSDAPTGPPAGASGVAPAEAVSEDAVFDAGPMGCGEIVLELRFLLAPMAPGARLRVIATDAGVREDLPAWCRMTGHTLLSAQPPTYVLQRRSNA